MPRAGKCLEPNCDQPRMKISEICRFICCLKPYRKKKCINYRTKCEKHWLPLDERKMARRLERSIKSAKKIFKKEEYYARKRKIEYQKLWFDTGLYKLGFRGPSKRTMASANMEKGPINGTNNRTICDRNHESRGIWKKCPTCGSEKIQSKKV